MSFLLTSLPVGAVVEGDTRDRYIIDEHTPTCTYERAYTHTHPHTHTHTHTHTYIHTLFPPNDQGQSKEHRVRNLKRKQKSGDPLSQKEQAVPSCGVLCVI